MRFYDLGEDTQNMAMPLRLIIPDRGLNLSYGGSDAMVFITTDGYQDDYGRGVPGRCIFGLDGETAHSELKDKLEDGETVTMRGVLWPKHNVMTIWQTFDYVSKMRELMKVVAGGLRDELRMNPGDVELFLGFMCPPSLPGRDCDAFNVAITVQEACELGGNGNCRDTFHELFIKDREQQKEPEEKPAFNGMRNRDFWRHYQVVGEGRKKVITLNEKELKSIIRKVLQESLTRAGRKLKK